MGHGQRCRRPDRQTIGKGGWLQRGFNGDAPGREEGIPRTNSGRASQRRRRGDWQEQAQQGSSSLQVVSSERKPLSHLGRSGVKRSSMTWPHLHANPLALAPWWPSWGVKRSSQTRPHLHANPLLLLLPSGRLGLRAAPCDESTAALLLLACASGCCRVQAGAQGERRTQARVLRHICSGTSAQARVLRHVHSGTSALDRHVCSGTCAQARVLRHICSGTSAQARVLRHVCS